MNSDCKVIIIKAPQRVLVSDILDRITPILEYTRPGRQNYLVIKSGGKTNQRLVLKMKRAGLQFEEIEDTTNPQVITDAYNEAVQSSKDLIIVTTYASAHRIKEANIPVYLEVNDEAHHLTERNNLEFDNFRISEGSKVMSMTATPVYVKDEPRLCMSNITKFGKHVKRGSRWAIKSKIILPPILHIMRCEHEYDNDEEKKKAFVSAVIKAFQKHQECLKKNSDKIGAKLLVTLPSCPNLKNVRDSEEIRNLFDDEGVNIISIDSENGGFINKAIYSDRAEAKEAIRGKLDSLKTEDKAIIFQVAMLSEGIDVPGITGALLLAERGDIPLFQLLGRALRVLSEDREQYQKNPKYKPIKKYGYVIVAIFGESEEQWSRHIRNLIRLFKKEYDYSPIEERFMFTDMFSSGKMEEDSRIAQEFTDEHFRHTIDDEIDSVTGASCYELIHKLYDYPDICKSILEEGKLYVDDEPWSSKVDDYAEMFDKWSDDDETTYDEIIKNLRDGGDDVFDETIKKKFGTIYTPDFVVKATCNLAWKYQDETKHRLDQTYIDPAAGDGNFLIELYHRLLIEPTDNPTKHGEPGSIERSRYILLNCIYGIEILDQMYEACRIKLITTHLSLVKKLNPSRLKEQTDVFKNLKIYFGNTILTKINEQDNWLEYIPNPKHTKGKKNKYLKSEIKGKNGKYPYLTRKYSKEKSEGGLISQLLTTTFDVVTGNPPYTQIILKNQAYISYPKANDMAQLFIRWALDHLTDNGVCSYNITDKWLNTKKNDTKTIMEYHIQEVIQTDEIKSYSVGDGGDNTTFIIAFTKQPRPNKTKEFILNGILTQYDTKISLTRPAIKYAESNFISRLLAKDYKFEFIKINKLSPKLIKYDPNKISGNWDVNTLIFESIGNKIAIRYQFQIRQYKLSDDPTKYDVGPKGPGRIQILTFNSNREAMFVIGYLYTTEALNRITEYTTQKGAGVLEINWNVFQHLQVPNFEYYSKKSQFVAYMKWIEENMGDKEKFLAGIDGQFEKLIKE